MKNFSPGLVPGTLKKHEEVTLIQSLVPLLGAKLQTVAGYTRLRTKLSVQHAQPCKGIASLHGATRLHQHQTTHHSNHRNPLRKPKKQKSPAQGRWPEQCAPEQTHPGTQKIYRIFTESRQTGDHNTITQNRTSGTKNHLPDRTRNPAALQSDLQNSRKAKYHSRTLCSHPKQRSCNDSRLLWLWTEKDGGRQPKYYRH